MNIFKIIGKVCTFYKIHVNVKDLGWKKYLLETNLLN